MNVKMGVFDGECRYSSVMVTDGKYRSGERRTTPKVFLHFSGLCVTI